MGSPPRISPRPMRLPSRAFAFWSTVQSATRVPVISHASRQRQLSCHKLTRNACAHLPETALHLCDPEKSVIKPSYITSRSNPLDFLPATNIWISISSERGKVKTSLIRVADCGCVVDVTISGFNGLFHMEEKPPKNVHRGGRNSTSSALLTWHGLAGLFHGSSVPAPSTTHGAPGEEAGPLQIRNSSLPSTFFPSNNTRTSLKHHRQQQTKKSKTSVCQTRKPACGRGVWPPRTPHPTRMRLGSVPAPDSTDPGIQGGWLTWWGSCHPRGRLGRQFPRPGSTRPSHCGSLRSEPAEAGTDRSLSLLLSLCPQTRIFLCHQLGVREPSVGS